MRAPVLLDAWQGLGDTIYLRSAVRALAGTHDVYVGTSWPELLEDLPVQFVRPNTQLRTQAENVQRQGRARWETPPPGARRLRPEIWWSRPLSIPASLAASLGLDPRELTFDLPSFPRPAQAPAGRYAVVRPVSVRTEWANPARNPDPRYVAAAAAALQDSGLSVVSVAHLQSGREWALDPLPPADVTLHAGELGVSELMGLVQHAELVVGGVGWIVPAAPAYGTPCIVIAGGWGFYGTPERLVGPPMDGARIRFVLPDRFCRWCQDMNHDCDREISGFAWRWAATLAELGVA